MDYSSSRSSGSHYSYGRSISSHTGIRGFFNTKCLRLMSCCAAVKRVITVEPVVFLYVFSAYLYIGMFELYSFNRFGWEELMKGNNSNLSNNSLEECLTVRQIDRYGPGTNNNSGDEVQGKVAVLNAYTGVSGQIPGIVSILILGPFSDKYGRRTAMGVVIVGLVLQSLLANIIIDFRLSLYFFILSSGLRTLTGGLAGLLTTSYSYIADISSKRWLTLRLGILEAMTFIASSLGLGVAGLWIQLAKCNFLHISWLILASSAALILYLIFFVRDSTNRQQAMRRRRLLTTGPKSLLVGFKIFFARGRPRWKLWLCLTTLCITVINQIGSLTIITLFLLHKPLEWDYVLIGGYLAVVELFHGLSLIIILPIMVGCSLRDPLIALFGVAIACATNTAMGFVAVTWQMFIAGSIQGVDAIITPALKAIMSKLVPPQEQGSLFSLISAMQVLSGAAAFVLYGLTYKASLELGWGAGTPFWLMAILYGISVPLLIALLVFSKKPNSQQPMSVNNSEATSTRPNSPTTQLPSSPTTFLPHQSRTARTGLTDGSVEWALPKSEAQFCPHTRSPPSIGRDVLERQSLLGRSRVSSSGYRTPSLNF